MIPKLAFVTNSGCTLNIMNQFSKKPNKQMEKNEIKQNQNTSKMNWKIARKHKEPKDERDQNVIVTY